MQQGNGSSYDHLMRQLDARLARIEHALDRLVDANDERHEHMNGRVSKLENNQSAVRGGWTVLAVIGSIAGAIGGVASKWLG